MTQPPLITISGRIASGTSGLSGHLADVFGWERISGGDIFRQQAADAGCTLDEYTKLCEENPEIDKQLDKQFEQIAASHASGERITDTGLILESRLSGWMAGDNADLKIWLDGPLDVRMERIENREETIEEARYREESEAQRWMEYHGVDIDNLELYDLVVNTAKWSEETVHQLVQTAVVQSCVVADGDV